MSNFNFNYVALAGRLTADIELKTTPSGVSICSGSIAVKRDYAAGDANPPSDFINFTAWRQTAEFLSKYFRKGSAIFVTGQLQTRQYEKDGQKRTVTELQVQTAKFIDSKGDVTGAIPESSYGNNGGKGTPMPEPAPMTEIGDGDGLPF